MAVAVKICGVNSAAAAEAAVVSGAAHIGLMFVPRSPRFVALAEAAALAARIPRSIQRVGVFTDPTDAELDRVLTEVPLEMIQLHGSESPARVAALRKRTGRLVMKAIAIGEAADIAAATAFQDAADWLLFDAKPPKSSPLRGGNAVAFDWALLSGSHWQRPWMLSGGLTAANLAGAVVATGAVTVDVSSGVEDAPGRKSPTRIREFMAAAKAIRT